MPTGLELVICQDSPNPYFYLLYSSYCIAVANTICYIKPPPLTISIILSPSSSLQFRFLRRWASSITTQRHGTLRSSGQSARIISKVVITAWNRYTPFNILPWIEYN